jgi:hypothetical protein
VAQLQQQMADQKEQLAAQAAANAAQASAHAAALEAAKADKVVSDALALANAEFNRINQRGNRPLANHSDLGQIFSLMSNARVKVAHAICKIRSLAPASLDDLEPAERRSATLLTEALAEMVEARRGIELLLGGCLAGGQSGKAAMVAIAVATEYTSRLAHKVPLPADPKYGEGEACFKLWEPIDKYQKVAADWAKENARLIGNADAGGSQPAPAPAPPPPYHHKPYNIGRRDAPQGRGGGGGGRGNAGNAGRGGPQ